MNDDMRQMIEDQLYLLSRKCGSEMNEVAYALTSESVMRAIIAEVVMRK